MWKLHRSTDNFDFYTNDKFDKYIPNPNGTRNSIKIHVSKNKIEKEQTHMTLEIIIYKKNDIIEKKFYYYPYNNSFSFETSKFKIIMKMLVSTWQDYCKQFKC